MNRRERRAALRASEGLPSPEEGLTMRQWIDQRARAMAEHFGFEGERLERATRQAKNMLLVRLMQAGEGR